MVRTQVQLTDEQSRAVKRLAAERGVSIAEIIRESVDAFVRARGAPTREEILQRTLTAIGALRGGPRDLARNHDKYAAEAFEQ
jgi:hypothetical protein